MLLLTAAMLKAAQLVLRPGDGDVVSMMGLPLLIGFEVALAFVLFRGRSPRLLWLVALVTFSVFAIISGGAALAGRASCGCFGTVHVPPKFTLILDGSILVALWIMRPPGALDRPWRIEWMQLRSLAMQATIPFVLAVTFGMGLSIVRAQWSRRHEGVTTIGAVTLLEPQRWIGQTLPIASQIDTNSRNDLLQGPWLIVLHRHDCPVCQRAMPMFKRLGRNLAGRVRVALVELPPYGSVQPDEPSSASAFIRARLSDASDWFVQTPAVLLVKDGTVQDAIEGETALGVSIDIAHWRLIPPRAEPQATMATAGMSTVMVQEEAPR